MTQYLSINKILTEKILSIFLLFLMLGTGVGEVWGQTVIHSLSDIDNQDGNYVLASDFSTTGQTKNGIGGPDVPFKGTIDGGLVPITGSWNRDIVSNAEDATFKNIIIANASIEMSNNHAGAIVKVAKGATRIYNCGINGGTISGGSNHNVGGLVGTLEGTSRVINCYSYANITGGKNKGGIVGNNAVASTQSSLTTMVMNCMFYGDIVDGNTIAPIYGGTEINNGANGLNNYNYYRYRSRYSKEKKITKYNRALAMEEKFITRFERYRLLLNSNKKLAAKYASTDAVTVNPEDMAKWVLETADRTIAEPKPYPVLKAQGKYPSIINYDATNAPDSASVGRLKGGKLGTKTLAVTILKKSQKTTGGQSWPTASASDVQTTSLTLIRTDKDTVRFNYNYDKVQLPYYNDIGTGNYTENRVVTGWKITSITGGTEGTYTESDSWGGYNFADRHCTKKDKYDVSKRVFSQGAYWDVPEGVTAITIEPYWAIANYVSDETYDVVYNKSYAVQTFTPFGTQYSNNSNIDIYGDGNNQKVYTSIANALAGFDNSNKTVYDQAVVLVGNLHQYADPTKVETPYTVMSIDMNHDNEPDYSFIFSHDNRKPISPIRFDFLNIMGIAEAQLPKLTDSKDLFRNVSIFNMKGWFEITNTCVVNFSQFEYDNSNGAKNAVVKSSAPLILLGGTYEQFVSTQMGTLDFTTPKTKYIHIGGNAWFAKFGNGTHSDGNKFTPHVPISVTGGDYDEFYLSGTYQPNITNMQSDNAECYVSGGRFGDMAGASLEAIQGDVRWQIDYADITYFYGGGVNGNNPITGDIRVDMTRSHVGRYCGGPKFGDMSTGKNVTTNATDCTFGTFFGAGFGGNSYNRVKYRDVENGVPASYQSLYTTDRGKYFNGVSSNAYDTKPAYGKKGKGVATDFDYEFFIWSSGTTGARFYVQFVSFSLARTNNVTSNLTGCTINDNFYGGGSLGKVNGTATSTLDGCTVKGNVFGGGYSATLPKIGVRNTPAFVAGKEPSKNINIGMFEEGEIADTVNYEWKYVESMPANGTDGTEGNRYVYTDEDLTTLGEVANTLLTITGGTTVGKSVYGGGEESAVSGDTEVKVIDGTIGYANAPTYADLVGNVYGGGKGKGDDAMAGLVKGNTTVKIGNPESLSASSPFLYHNVYGGGAYGSVGTYEYYGETNEYTTEYNKYNPNGTAPDADKLKALLAKKDSISSWTSGGTTNIEITGGVIGTNGKENGMVFGSSRGDVAKPVKGLDYNDRLAWVNVTHVVIGDENKGTDKNGSGKFYDYPLIKGSVYGSGENGHTLTATYIDIHSGTIGIESGEPVTDENTTIPYEGPHYLYRGNVYGGGCGTDMYDSDGDEQNANDSFNFLAGIVMGNTNVNIDGGHVVHNVYGGGAMGSVGTYTSFADAAYVAEQAALDKEVPLRKPLELKAETGQCTVTISGGEIGTKNMQMHNRDTNRPDDFGHVFGAGRGDVIDPKICYNIESCGFFGSTELTIKGTAFIRGSVFGGSESGHVFGDTHVVIGDDSGSQCQIGSGDGEENPYDESAWATAESTNALKPTNHWDYIPDGAPYDQNVIAEGKYSNNKSAEGGSNVATDGHTFYGNVYGGGSGYYPYGPGDWLFSAGRVEGSTRVEIKSGHILNNVYGGCEMSDVLGDAKVIMTGGTVGVPLTKAYIVETNPTIGHIYGAGMGDKRIFFNQVTNVASSTVEVSGGKVYGSVHGGGEDGHVLGLAKTTISGDVEIGSVKDGTTSGFDGNVFGGGQGSPTALTAGTVGGNVELNIEGGTMHGSVYGGGRIASVGTFFEMAKIPDPDNPNKEIDNPNYGKMQDGDNHGCITVNLKGGTIIQNVYGGCMGTRGMSAVDQVRFAVSKNVTVNLNEGVADNAKGCIVKGSIFGCNNVNSSPQGQVTVHIYKTQNAAASKIAGTDDNADADHQPKKEGRFDVKAVYGGGNMAAYLPKGPDTGNGDYNGKNTTFSTNVIIDGCDRTSIEQVYGGGNAASAPATCVTVNGTFEINELFGGGNGKDRITYDEGVNYIDNPGANVGFYDYSAEEDTYNTKEKRTTAEGAETFISKYVYGTGKAEVNIFGGTLNYVFGGSNTKGNVRETAITLLEEKQGTDDCCPFNVGEVYGGGKSAPMDADAKIYMACIPGLRAAYGGAEAADIQGGVTLNITNGTFDRVFGGNNLSGTIRGPIEVNIEETGCRPIIIGELYGGGNQAGYSVYGYKEVGGKWVIRDASDGVEPGLSKFADPVVNVKSFTSIGEIYGGGFGAGATMVGNPTVNINEAVGTPDEYPDSGDFDEDGFKVKTFTIDEGKATEHTVTCPAHTKGKIGVINNVFGGGNAAEVRGNTQVNIGTAEYLPLKSVVVGKTIVKGYFTRTGEGTSESPYEYTEITSDDATASEGITYYARVLGADIRGNVYGGGNNAPVTGNTDVVIGKHK